MYLTRNQAYRKVTGVRIPPSPPRPYAKALIFRAFLFLACCKAGSCSTSGTTAAGGHLLNVGFATLHGVPLQVPEVSSVGSSSHTPVLSQSKGS
jgi:hypothetical protein